MPECTSPWEENNGTCYFWSQDKLFWGAAEEKCRELGGHLASVATEHNYLRLKVGKIKTKKKLYVFQGHIHSNIWIGATDQSNEGNWTWTDCSPWKFTRWGLRDGQQQPDNSRLVDGDGENCGLLQGKNTTKQGWEDVACNLKEREFVCSRPVCSGEKSFGRSF